MRQEPGKRLLPIVASQFWAFVLLVPELDSITLHENRFNLHWTRGDLLVYFLGVTLLGVAIWLAGVVIRSVLHRWYSVICLGAAIISLAFLLWAFLVRRPVSPLVREALVETPLAFFAGVVIAGISWRLSWTPDKWKTGLTALALVFSPAMPIFWLNATAYSTYGSSSSPEIESIAPAAEAPRDNVFIFIFDAWSHRLTLEDGELTPEFSHLRDASPELFVFEGAHSPHNWTLVSIPRMIYGQDDALDVAGGRLRFRGDADRSTDAMPSIFTRAREVGYRTYMVGWSMPYEALLGSSVDHVRSVPEPLTADQSAWRKLASFYWRDAIKILPAGIVRRTPLTNRGIEIYSRHIHNTEKLVSLVDLVLEEPRNAQFAVFHLPVPHSPFCYERGGVKPRGADYNVDVVADARLQHAYLDSLIERFIERLRSNGKYDNSTIILTSDHNWREDPGLPQPLPRSEATRVPLFIKLPGHSAGETIASPFSTVHLGEALEALRSGEQGLPEIVERYPLAPAGESNAERPPMDFIGR